MDASPIPVDYEFSPIYQSALDHWITSALSGIEDPHNDSLLEAQYFENMGLTDSSPTQLTIPSQQSVTLKKCFSPLTDSSKWQQSKDNALSTMVTLQEQRAIGMVLFYEGNSNLKGRIVSIEIQNNPFFPLVFVIEYPIGSGIYWASSTSAARQAQMDSLRLKHLKDPLIQVPRWISKVPSKAWSYDSQGYGIVPLTTLLPFEIRSGRCALNQQKGWRDRLPKTTDWQESLSIQTYPDLKAKPLDTIDHLIALFPQLEYALKTQTHSSFGRKLFNVISPARMSNGNHCKGTKPKRM